MKRSVVQVVRHPNLILEALKKIFEGKGLKFHSSPEVLCEANEWDAIHCLAYHIPNGRCGRYRFRVQQLPGCCASLVLHYMTTGLDTKEDYQHLIGIVAQAAYDAGFGNVMMAQVVPDYNKKTWNQEPWILCLNDGWKPSKPFRNAKSGNLVTLLTKDLLQEGRREGLEFPIEN
jgi:hypothetical protein